MNSIRYSKGNTLIELFVAIIIVSIGLLGLAGLQISGMRSVNNSSYYTQGTLAVNDIIERMRVNPTAVNDNAFAAVNAISCAAAPAPYCSEFYGSGNVTAGNCNPAQLAAFDLYVWFCGDPAGSAGVADTFPNASVNIDCEDALNTDTDPCTNGSRHTITLSWDEMNPNRDKGANTVTKSLIHTVQPQP